MQKGGKYISKKSILMFDSTLQQLNAASFLRLARWRITVFGYNNFLHHNSCLPCSEHSYDSEAEVFAGTLGLGYERKGCFFIAVHRQGCSEKS